MPHYAVRQTHCPSEWADLFARVPHPHQVQSWAYGEAKRQTGWHPRRLVIERDGGPVALCLVLDVRVPGMRLASRINRGPMLLQTGEPDVEGIHRALRRGWRQRGPLLIGPALPSDGTQAPRMRAAGYRPLRQPGWGSAYLDLSLSEQQLRKNLTSRWRNHLSVSERRGLTLRVSTDDADAAWLLDRHAENMREKGFKKPTPALVRALRAAAPEDFLVFQACLDGAPVGGAAVVRFGHAAEYYIAWYGPEGRKANAGNFLLWHAALEMRRRGCRSFDLGGISEGTGYSGFKRPMNGVNYLLLGEWVSLW